MRIVIILFLLLLSPCSSSLSNSLRYYPGGGSPSSDASDALTFVVVGAANIKVIYDRKKVDRLALKPLLSDQEIRMIKRKRLWFGLTAIVGTGAGVVSFLMAKDASGDAKTSWYVLGGLNAPMVVVSIDSIRKCTQILRKHRSQK